MAGLNIPHYYIYNPLSTQCIRILQLHPGLPDAPLVCNIVNEPIGDTPYEALSYVWGDSTPVASVKCVNEAGEVLGELGIGNGLAIALVAFRLTDQKRRMWIDALCINQKDVAERQSQVRLMGDVYSTAEHVLCWLGPFDDHDEDAESKALLAVRFLRSFNENPQGNLQAARQHLHAVDDTVDVDTNTDGQLLNSWLAIKRLFDIEYFHRAWIIQEVGLARHARFYWAKQELWLDWSEVTAFCRFMDDNGASVINLLQLKSWVASHITFVWETDSSGKPIFSFIEVLHWARVHRSTDPRDYIYALLSHPNAKVNGTLLVQPNYRITPTQAYIELALNVIERTNSLHILAFVDHHEEASDLALPSWVPDWHALNLVAPMRCPTQAATEKDISISVAESATGMVVKCRGFFIDTVRTMSNMIEPSDLIITTLEKEMQKKIPFLIDHIWKQTVIECGIPLSSLGQLVASLSLVLTGGFLNDLHSTSGKTQEQQQSDFAAFVLDYERIRPRDHHSETLFTSLSPEDQVLIRRMAASGSAHQFVQDMTWTSMCRKVFRTAKGHIGLGPRIMRDGDICVVILGAVYPMVLRRCDEYFQLVGPALLYGFMNGEAEKLAQDGTLFEHKFEII